MPDCDNCGGKLAENESMRRDIPGNKEGSTTYRYYDCMRI